MNNNDRNKNNGNSCKTYGQFHFNASLILTADLMLKKHLVERATENFKVVQQSYTAKERAFLLINIHFNMKSF